jgi:hypothetical protein
MREYPRNPTFESVSESRVSALAGFGFTQRQREFLVTVMVHAGCFLERQYCAFTGTVRGQNSRDFVARLVARGFARSIEPGPVRRGRLYHVHHKPLYEAVASACPQGQSPTDRVAPGRAFNAQRCQPLTIRADSSRRPVTKIESGLNEGFVQYKSAAVLPEQRAVLISTDT